MQRRGAEILFLTMLTLMFGWFAFNVHTNLTAQGITSGFGFLSSTAGFGIISHLIAWDETSTYGRALIVGLLNTLLVSVLGIIFTTVLGVLVGIARLSSNWLLSKMAGAFVELMRNLPLLLVIFFLYFGLLRLLPSPQESLNLFESVWLNNRGLYLPWINSSGAAGWLSIPVLDGFDFTGGLAVTPEFLALVVALTIYTAGFVAEIVRGGILAVAKGQTEAALSLGLTSAQRMRLVILPQAMRAIVPQMTSQYLNLTKNSSLAAAIGYPDITQVFAGTVLSQTGQAVEVIFLTMATYLTLSLLIAVGMGFVNRRSQLQERRT